MGLECISALDIPGSGIPDAPSIWGNWEGQTAHPKGHTRIF